MAYTATNWVEGVTTLGPTNMNKIENELVYLDARIAPAAVAYGTSLPGSPVDGQQAILVDSTTNPSYVWVFRYNASSTSSYKWECVGGAPARTEILTSEPLSVTTGAWTNLTTPGPDVVVPRAGEYVADVRAKLDAIASTATASLGVVNASTASQVGAYTQLTPVSGAYASMSAQPFITVTAAGQTLRESYAATAAHAFSQRSIAVIPKRVA